MIQPATIKPAFYPYAPEAVKIPKEDDSLVLSTIAPTHTPTKDHTVLKIILLNLSSTILKSDSFLTSLFATRYLSTKSVKIVDTKASVIPTTG